LPGSQGCAQLQQGENSIVLRVRVVLANAGSMKLRSHERQVDPHLASGRSQHLLSNPGPIVCRAGTGDYMPRGDHEAHAANLALVIQNPDNGLLEGNR
jgi:hypothetical protein